MQDLHAHDPGSIRNHQVVAGGISLRMGENTKIKLSLKPDPREPVSYGQPDCYVPLHMSLN